MFEPPAALRPTLVGPTGGREFFEGDRWRPPVIMSPSCPVLDNRGNAIGY